MSENSIESLRGLEGHLSLQKVDMSSTGIFFFFLLMGADEGGEGQCLGEGGEGQCLGNGGGAVTVMVCVRVCVVCVCGSCSRNEECVL